MKRDRLKPYVYKVEGAVNFAFYDILNGRFYQFSPEGTVEEFRNLLLEEDLIFETEDIVPNKILRQDMWDIQNNLQIRVLQIRLNGRGEDNCWNRRKKRGEKEYIGNDILNRLQERCRYIPIDVIRIEAEEEEEKKLEAVLNEFECKKIELNIESGIAPGKIEKYRKISDSKEIVVLKDGRKNITDLKVEIFNFFYSKYFNPCLGHQVAIDTKGEIKCCLWSEECIGNIETSDLKDLIIRGAFDRYWECNKNKIESCKDCELRFACSDCRISALANTGRVEAKPPYCEYDPYTGE